MNKNNEAIESGMLKTRDMGDIWKLEMEGSSLREWQLLVEVEGK